MEFDPSSSTNGAVEQIQESNKPDQLMPNTLNATPSVVRVIRSPPGSFQVTSHYYIF